MNSSLSSSFRVDKVHQAVETMLNTLSIVFNLILLYLIKNYSTFRVPIYQFLLAVDAGLDLALGIVVLIGQQVAFTGDGYFIMITDGFYAHSSRTYDSVMLPLFGVALHTNVLWTPIQFSYRYIFLCRSGGGDSPKKLLLTVAVVSIAWNVVGFIVIYAMFHPPSDFQPKGLRILKMNEWPLDDGVEPPVFGSHLTDIRLIAWVALWFISSGGGAIVVIVCELKIVKHFRVLGNAYHETTRQMHREFHRALLAMAVCPVITSGIPVFFFIITICFSLCPGSISAFVTTGTTCITLFNPLTTIFFMRCYRDAIFKRFRKAQARVTGTGTTADTGLNVTTSDHSAGNASR